MFYVQHHKREFCGWKYTKIEIGNPKTYSLSGDSGKTNNHFFCGRCGSSLYTELEIMPNVVCVKAGSLDGSAASLGGKIGVEFYTVSRVSYLTKVQPETQQCAKLSMW